MTVVDRVPEIWPETRLDPDFFFLIKKYGVFRGMTVVELAYDTAIVPT